MKKRKIPLRKCLGCNESKPKKELIRIVKNKENEVSVDLTGKVNGRGAYVCNDVSCLEKSRTNKKLNRALEIEIPDQIYEELMKEINNAK